MVLMLGVTFIITVGGLLSPVLGSAMDRRSMRKLMLTGAVLLVAGFLCLSQVRSMTQALIVYATLMSVACTLLGPISTNTLVARWFVRRRGMAMGIAALGGSIGGFIFPPLLQGMIDAYGWRVALQLLAGLIFVLLIPTVYFLAIDRPSDRGLFPDGDSAPAAGTGQSVAPNLSTRDVLGDLNFWLIVLATGLPFAGITGVMGNLVPLVVSKGVSTSVGALLISSFSIGGLVGKLLFAAVGDRVDLRIALGACLLGVSASMLCFWYATGYTLMVPGSFLLGVMIGVIGPLWGFLLARGFGVENIGLVMGLIALMTMPFSLSAAPFLGWVFDDTGSYNDGLLIIAGLCAAALLTLPRIRTGLRAAPQPALS
jgi:MFS family permease